MEFKLGVAHPSEKKRKKIYKLTEKIWYSFSNMLIVMLFSMFLGLLKLFYILTMCPI